MSCRSKISHHVFMTCVLYLQAYNKATDLYTKLFDDLLSGRAVSVQALDSILWFVFQKFCRAI